MCGLVRGRTVNVQSQAEKLLGSRNEQTLISLCTVIQVSSKFKFNYYICYLVEKTSLSDMVPRDINIVLQLMKFQTNSGASVLTYIDQRTIKRVSILQTNQYRIHVQTEKWELKKTKNKIKSKAMSPSWTVKLKFREYENGTQVRESRLLADMGRA